MKKIIRIDFAKKVFDPPTFHDTWNSFIDIREAIEFAACNLKQRYGVTIGPIELTGGEYYKLVMDIPDEIATGFNIGHHLRGISAYLLKKSKHKDIYSKNKVGTRLLVFSEEIEEVRKPGFDDKRRLRLLRDISIWRKRQMADKSWDDQYISKTDAIKLAIISIVPYTNYFNILDFQRSFEKTIGGFTPSADVAEVRRGEWVDGDVDDIGACGIEYRYKKCSICDYEYSFPIKYNFCPNCGADMKSNAK